MSTRRRLAETNPEAWRAAHGRLFEHLRDTTLEGETPTLEDLAPLYQAVPHGCRAGRHAEALQAIYRDRICRRTADGHTAFYASKRLGAFGTDLAAISWFFEKPYETLVGTLTASDQPWVLGVAANCLRAQGRIAEAISTARIGLRMHVIARDWRNAAIDTANLSGVELVVGEVAAAVATTEQSVDYAIRSGDAPLVPISRLTRADALYAAGQQEEAKQIFNNTERQLTLWQPEYPMVYSVHGRAYSELLLARGEWVVASEQASLTLERAGSESWLLNIAHATLNLGRAHLGMALAVVLQRPTAGVRHDVHTAQVSLSEAADRLRATGQSDYVPSGLLARAAFRRTVGDWDGAARDLDEVEEMAEPGPMRLHLCDMALERARLAFARIAAFAPLNGLNDTSPPNPAPPSAGESAKLAEEGRLNLATARDLIESCGYHRRDEELAELEAVRDGHRRFADLPPRV